MVALKSEVLQPHLITSTPLDRNFIVLAMEWAFQII